MNWEEAVVWLRSQPEQHQLVLDCYYDDPPEDAVRRFSESEEWADTLDALGPVRGLRVLDLGAGRGIASYAFAAAGAVVTSLEPDPSPLVGTGCIRTWSQRLNVNVRIVEKWGESLPFSTSEFDLVYARAVLHHARDLRQLCIEIRRVLSPDGRLFACREHVLTNQGQLQQFLAAHPLHRLYGGENAYTLLGYLGALARAELIPKKIWGPAGAAFNYAPVRREAHQSQLDSMLRRRLPLSDGLIPRRLLRPLVETWLAMRDQTPGRHFAFLCQPLA